MMKNYIVLSRLIIICTYLSTYRTHAVLVSYKTKVQTSRLYRSFSALLTEISINKLLFLGLLFCTLQINYATHVFICGKKYAKFNTLLIVKIYALLQATTVSDVDTNFYDNGNVSTKEDK